ncbi:DUF599 family protein [Rhizobium sp. KVB221]|uniref:DUF599 family protein n=1 Tax=Rhizobium setariae TaxID=2801340 RepID=A0A936YUR3_9HYPH|nr:DUF599 family protein [Rhizobium setariae]MBL0375079.1 DUF599 family protein [Rhizobium setariae]
MTVADYIALAFFITLWGAFNWLTSGERTFKRVSVTRAMTMHRSNWIRNSLHRDLKMIDTSIMAGLQNGTAFFGSTSLLALGSSFALLGATEQAQALFADLPSIFHSSRTAFELKVGGLSAIFAYSFFKFGWSYRLFNYCSILFGALPMQADALKDPHAANLAAERVIAMNVIAAKSFNAGLRGLFLSIGYLGWFVNAYVFAAMSVFVFTVLIRRQFFSEARNALLRGLNI